MKGGIQRPRTKRKGGISKSPPKPVRKRKKGGLGKPPPPPKPEHSPEKDEAAVQKSIQRLPHDELEAWSRMLSISEPMDRARGKNRFHYLIVKELSRRGR